MTAITKALGEKKADDKMDQPLVVDDAQGDSNQQDPEAQNPKVYLGGHYLILRRHALRSSSATLLALFFTALLILSFGIIGGVCIYRQYARDQMHRFRTGWYSIPYDGSKASYIKDDLPSSFFTDSDLFNSLTKATDALELANSMDNDIRNFFKERFELDTENLCYEKIDVPDFRGGRQGRFIHDFTINMTGIVDVDGHCCFVMPLDRQRVLPPRNMHDLLKKMFNSYYEVDTEIVRETMRVVTPPLANLSSVGTYIARECQDLPTYMLEKANVNIIKRSTSEGIFGHFAGKNIVELDILNWDEVRAYSEKENN